MRRTYIAIIHGHGQEADTVQYDQFRDVICISKKLLSKKRDKLVYIYIYIVYNLFVYFKSKGERESDRVLISICLALLEGNTRR